MFLPLLHKYLKMKSPHYLFAVLFLCLSFVSCIDEQDFNQTDDIIIEPTVEASIFYFETTEDLINSNPSSFYTNDFNFDAFKEDYISDRVIECIITYQLENTTSKPVSVVIELIDDGGNVLDTTVLNIGAESATTTDLDVLYGGTGKPLDIIRNTSALRLSAQNLGDNTSVSSNADPKLIFRSSAKLKIGVR
ncbi:Conserved hypothetical protein [Cellulophaga lytica]|nr:Conserved hypothetical protein [Cellulophaga lytica]